MRVCVALGINFNTSTLYYKFLNRFDLISVIILIRWTNHRCEFVWSRITDIIV